MKKVVYRRRLMALVCGLMVGSLLLPAAAFAQRAGGGNRSQTESQQQEDQDRLERERRERERREREERERREREERERRERERLERERREWERRERERLERERWEWERRERERLEWERLEWERRERLEWERQRQDLRVQMPTGNWLIQSTQFKGNDGYWDLDGPAFFPGALLRVNNGAKERLYGNVFTFVPVYPGEPGWYYIRDGQGHGVGMHRDADGVILMAFAAVNTPLQQFRVEWNDTGDAFRLYTRSGRSVAVDSNRNNTVIQTMSLVRDTQVWWQLVFAGSNRRNIHSRW